MQLKRTLSLTLSWKLDGDESPPTAAESRRTTPLIYRPSAARGDLMLVTNDASADYVVAKAAATAS